MRFIVQEVKIVGTPTWDDYNTDFYIRIQASDGYSNALAYFTIKCTKVPLVEIFNIILEIGGPLSVLIFFWEMKVLIYWCLCSRKYKYGKEYVMTGE